MNPETAWAGGISAATLATLFATLGGCGGYAPEETATEEQEEQGEPFDLPPAPSVELVAGRETFMLVCAHCHTESEYAPLTHNPREWKRRLDRAENGVETLYEHAINGFGEMLPKGGRRGKDLTDDQVKAAVDYAIAAFITPETE